METKDILINLRNANNITQEDMAKSLHVTRQAVSRWENGETTPNIDTLKLISKKYHISINTILGSPRELTCQCCGMPLADDSLISEEKDNSLNEEFCKWCYEGGEFKHPSVEHVIEACIPFLLQSTPDFSEKQLREYLNNTLPKLSHWNKK